MLLNYIFFENKELFFFFLQFIFFSFLLFLVFTDDRFKKNRKIFFLFLNLFYLSLVLYIEKAPLIIIKDLFWYSQILNGSFILHVLVLDRIFHWAWKKKYEYLGFIISRISFTLSLSGLLYGFQRLNISIMKYFKDNDLKYYIKYFLYIGDLINIIIWHFSILFINYSLFILGKVDKSFNLKIILKYIIIYILFFLIAYCIGIPRLYIIWLFQLIVEIYKIFTFEYYNTNWNKELKTLEWKEKYKFFKKNIKEDFKDIWSTYHINKYEELIKIYEEPYHIFFMFDIYKFLYDKYSRGLSREIWCEFYTIYSIFEEDINSSDLKFPILKIYQFYPWEEMAIGYCRAKDLTWNPNGLQNDQRLESDRLIEAFQWIHWINRDQELLLKLIPDLITEEILPIEDEEIYIDFIKNVEEILENY